MKKMDVILQVMDDIAVIVEVEEKIDKKTAKPMVVARAIDCENLMLESVSEVFHAITDMTVEDNSRLWANLLMKPVYVSVARCHPNDIFDFETGAKIALIKLKEKLESKIMNRRYVLAKEFYAMAVRCYPPNSENMDKIAEKMEKKILKYVKLEEE